MKDGDEYKATRILVNTDTEDIRLEGEVSGSVSDKAADDKKGTPTSDDKKSAPPSGDKKGAPPPGDGTSPLDKAKPEGAK